MDPRAGERERAIILCAEILTYHFYCGYITHHVLILSLLCKRLNGKMVLNSILKFNYLLKEYLQEEQKLIFNTVVASYRYLSWESLLVNQ